MINNRSSTENFCGFLSVEMMDQSLISGWIIRKILWLHRNKSMKSMVWKTPKFWQHENWQIIETQRFIDRMQFYPVSSRIQVCIEDVSSFRSSSFRETCGEKLGMFVDNLTETIGSNRSRSAKSFLLMKRAFHCISCKFTTKRVSDQHVNDQSGSLYHLFNMRISCSVGLTTSVRAKCEVHVSWSMLSSPAESWKFTWGASNFFYLCWDCGFAIQHTHDQGDVLVKHILRINLWKCCKLVRFECRVLKTRHACCWNMLPLSSSLTNSFKNVNGVTSRVSY